MQICDFERLKRTTKIITYIKTVACNLAREAFMKRTQLYDNVDLFAYYRSQYVMIRTEKGIMGSILYWAEVTSKGFNNDGPLNQLHAGG